MLQDREQAVRERAYALWERDGRPEGRSERRGRVSLALVKLLPRGGRLKNPGVLRTSMVYGRSVYRASLVYPTTKARSTAPKAGKQEDPLSW
jgi:hypothetical protein